MRTTGLVLIVILAAGCAADGTGESDLTTGATTGTADHQLAP